MTANPQTISTKAQKGTRMHQYVISITACISVFTAGILLAWPTPFLKIIMSSSYPFEISKDEGCYVVIISYVGYILGSVIAPHFTNAIGKKWTLLSIGIPQLSAFVMIYISYKSKYLLYGARILGGIGEGASLIVVPVYMAEISETNIRKQLGICMSLIFISGMIFVNLLGSYVNMHTTALICMAFPVVFWLIFIHCPETSHYCLWKNNKNKDVQHLRIIGKSNTEKGDNNFSEDIEPQIPEAIDFKYLFIVPSNRKAFLIISASRFFQQFTGCPAYGLYSQLLLAQATNVPPIIGSTSLMLTQIVGILLSIFIVDNIGRRRLLILSSGLSSFMLFIHGTFATIKTYNYLDLSQFRWFPFMVMIFLILCYTCGLIVGVNLLITEMFDSNIRNKAISLGSIAYAASLMASIKFYQYTADNLGLAVTFYTYAICCLVGAFFFYIVLPETKDKTFEEVQRELSGTVK